METRTCTSCKQELPATDEYFHWQKRKDGSYVLRSYCKKCRIATEKARYEADRERILEYHRQLYIDNPEPKKAYARRRRIEKPEIVREEQRLYRLNNQDKIKADKRVWHQANKERKKVQWAAWKVANPERAKDIQRRYRARHRVRENARISAYQKLYPEKCLARRQNRRAREVNAEGSFTTQDIYNLWLDQEGRCAYCGCAINYRGKGKFQIDHVMPLVKGGTNYPSNLALCCKPCNQSKGHSDLIPWLIRKFL